MGYTKVEFLRKIYPQGTRIELIEMMDAYGVRPHMLGTVEGVDDAENILMKWDNGSRLSLIYDLDKFRKVLGK